MSVISANQPEFVLVHPRVTATYRFRPFTTDTGADEEGVAIVHTTVRGHHTYSLTTEEARQLWRRLRRQGYDRF